MAFNVHRTSENKRAETFKAHITSKIDAAAASTWTDFTGYTKVDAESNGGVIELEADTKTFTIKKSGFYHFGGCVHVKNPTVGLFTDVTILVRLLENGSTEMRCSQRGKVISLGASGGEDVLSLNGSFYLEAGETVKCQYFTSSTDLDFDSNTNFDNTVAATLWFIYMGN